MVGPTDDGLVKDDRGARGSGVPRVEVRPYTEADEAAALALHERGFGQPWPRELWLWRARPAFGGDPCVMAAFANGKCLALLAGVRLPCRHGGERGFVITVSNSVLDPAAGRTLLGARVFLHVVDRFVRTFGKAPVLMMYGAPIPSLVRAMTVRVGVEVLGDVFVLGHDLDGASAWAMPPDPGLVITSEPELPAGVDELWQRLAGAKPSGVERDARFLQWRFATHPTVGYEVVSARSRDGTLRGLMVVRDGGWRPDVLSICEWLVAHDDAATERALLQYAIAAARERGCVGVAAWFSSNAPEFQRWQRRWGFRTHATSHQLVFRAFDHGIDRRALFDRWRMTMADLEWL